MKRLLIVEDDLFTMRLMHKYFESMEFIIYKAADIGGALNALSSFPVDAVIMDINLPSGSSIQNLQKVRPLFSGPIIFYTSDTKNSTELDALNMGGDDLVHKERGLPILGARLQRILSQHKSSVDNDEDNQKAYVETVDIFTHRFTWNGCEYQLSANESKLAHFFLANMGKLCSRDELSMVVYGFPYDGVGRGLDIMISRMRKKLKKITNNQLRIDSIRGKGYRLSLV